ncbi:MAG: hypothetical protein ACMXX5_01575 [Candidatus Woesearchaeota archaeon]
MFPKYSSGISHIKECLAKAIKEIDIEKLVSYALKIEVKSVIRRLGYILEELKVKNNNIKLLHKNIGKGFELLDPSLKSANNLNKKWLLDINTI